jgi:membrane-associated phospholipid phosphatase
VRPTIGPFASRLSAFTGGSRGRYNAFVRKLRPHMDDAHSPMSEGRSNIVVIREHRAVVEFARTLSTIFNPFVSATALFVIVSHAFSRNVRQFWELSFAGLLFFTIAPVLCIFYLYLSGRISDFDMSDRLERRRAFIAFVAVYLIAAVVLTVLHAPVQLIAVTWGYVGTSIATMVITQWWKISTHAFGITGPFAALFLLFGLQALPYAAIVPMVWWARVYLRAHSVAQVLAGAAVSVASVLIFFKLFHLV